MPKTLVEALHAAAANPRPHALVRFVGQSETDVDTLSWAQVTQRAQKVATSLRVAGLSLGERVGIVLPTAPTFFDAFFGVLLAGGVPVPLYPPVRLGRFEPYVARTTAMLRACGAVAVLSDSRTSRWLGRIEQQAAPRLGLRDIDALRALTPAAPLDLPNPSPEDLALIQFSSGSTGAPKPVALTHRAILANATRLLAMVDATTPLDAEVPASCVCWLPLYHDMGLVGCVLTTMLGPGVLTLIAPERFLANPAIWLRTLSHWRGTISPAPDFAYALCAERIPDSALEGVDLSCWKMALNGAQTIAADTITAFSTRFAHVGFAKEAFQPVYGMSEMALAITRTPTLTGPRIEGFDRDALYTHHTLKRASTAPSVYLVALGTPLDGYAVKVVNHENTPLSDGQVGRILVFGPSMMEGYLGFAPEAQPFVDGWLDTGDLGAVFDGVLWLVGRQKDVLIVRGKNISPTDLEHAASGVSGVRKGCVVAIAEHSTSSGEHIVVLAESHAPHEDLASTIAHTILAQTGIQPDLVVILEPGTLPRTSSGKMRRFEAAQLWSNGTLLPPDKLTSARMLGHLAHSTLARLQAAYQRSQRA